VGHAVRLDGQHLQILWAVVMLNPIDMMHMFVRRKLSPNHLLCNHAVFSLPCVFAPNLRCQDNVPRAVHLFASLE
jgi:hypothetical protein